MNDKELVRFISQGNKTTDMETMAYMNAVDELCERFEALLGDKEKLFEIVYNNAENIDIAIK